jgi:hypothetical protein
MHEMLFGIAGLEEKSLPFINLAALQARRQDRSISWDGDDLCRDEETLQRITALTPSALQEMGREIQMRAGMRAEGQGR